MIDAARIFGHLPAALRRHRLILAWIRLTRQSPVQLVRVNGGNWVYVDLSDGFMRLIVIEGGYDPEFFRVATPFMRSAGDFIDVGANFGICSFGLCGLSRTAARTFHLFEPNPHLIPILERTRRRYPHEYVRLINRCVSDRLGELRFRIGAEQTGISCVDPQGELIVATVTIDDYLAEAQVGQIALMKVDVEGHELPVFRGASRAMAAGRIPAIYFEHFPTWIMRQGQPPESVLKYLRGLDYDLYFCRSDDPNIGDQQTPPQLLDVNGTSLKVWPVRSDDVAHNTDLLAIHKSAGLSDPISAGAAAP